MKSISDLLSDLINEKDPERRKAVWIGLSLALLGGLAVGVAARQLVQRLSGPRLMVVSLRLYPVKSCAGIEVENAEMTCKGFRYDRRFVVVNPADGKQITQRLCPKLALIKPALITAHNLLILSAPGMVSTLQLELEETPFRASHEPSSSHVPEPLATVGVDVWGWEGQAQHMGELAAEWLSEFLGRPAVLARQLNAMERPTAGPLVVDGRQLETGGDQVSFADGFPYLMTSMQSLAQVNQWIASNSSEPQAPLTMRRFRPNIVVSGEDNRAFAEDSWRVIRFSRLALDRSAALVTRLYNQKICGRCVLTTVDPDQGKFSPCAKDAHGVLKSVPEPLHCLRRNRQRDNGEAYFGVNLVGDLHSFGKLLCVGDITEVEAVGQVGHDIDL